MIDYIKRTWVSVSLDNLAHNYRQIRGVLPAGCKFLGIVKADAYGHGAVAISRELERLGADYLAVSDLEEAVQIRCGGVQLPILILGYTPPEYAALLVEKNLTQEVNSLDYGLQLQKRLSGTGQRLKVHIKLDTGMSRLGFAAYDRPETISEIVTLAKQNCLELEGVFAHFSVADSVTPEDQSYTALQFSRFMQTLDALKAEGVTFALRHHANSGAILQYPEYALDMVRSGIATYGLFPAEELKGCLDLRPTFSLYTSIAQIKDYAGQTPVSYGRTYITESARRIAVVPVGYADGLMRCLSSGTELWLDGCRVPIVGRICMDMCMIDISEVPQAKVGDTVTIFGSGNAGENTCYDLAEQARTIPYEILCAVSKRVPRLYYRDGHTVDLLRYIV